MLEDDRPALLCGRGICIPGAAQHQLARATDDATAENGAAAPGYAHGFVQLIQRAGGQIDEAILHQPGLAIAHVQTMPARIRSGDMLATQPHAVTSPHTGQTQCRPSGVNTRRSAWPHRTRLPQQAKQHS